MDSFGFGPESHPGPVVQLFALSFVRDALPLLQHFPTGLQDESKTEAYPCDQSRAPRTFILPTGLNRSSFPPHLIPVISPLIIGRTQIFIPPPDFPPPIGSRHQGIVVVPQPPPPSICCTPSATGLPSRRETATDPARHRLPAFGLRDRITASGLLNLRWSRSHIVGPKCRPCKPKGPKYIAGRVNIWGGMESVWKF